MGWMPYNSRPWQLMCGYLRFSHIINLPFLKVLSNGNTDIGTTHVESSKLTKISSSMPGGDYSALELGIPFESYKNGEIVEAN